MEVAPENYFVVNFYVLLSFIIYFITFIFFYYSKQPFLYRISFNNAGKLFSNDAIFSNYFLIGCILFTICHSIYYIDLYSRAVGSFEEALVRFYSKNYNYKRVSEWEIKFEIILNSVLLLLIAILRFTNNLVHSKKRYAVFIFCFVAVILMAFPRGTRGYLILPLFLVIFADLLHKHKFKSRSILKDLFKVDLAVISVSVMLLVFVLSNIRGNSFENPTELNKYLSKNNEKVEYTLNKGSKSDPFEVTRFIEYSILNFGTKHDYLLFHTPYSMIVNLIPRSFWQSKPVGFGFIIAQYSHGYSHDMEDVFKAASSKSNKTSFAAGLAGEGYANGGLFGILFLSFLIGWITGILGCLSKYAFASDTIFVNVFGLVFFQASTSFVRGAMLDAWVGSVYPIVLQIMVIYFFWKFKVIFTSIIKS